MTANVDVNNSFHFLTVGLLDGIATVELSRPPVNAVSMQMYGELYSLFSDIDQLGDVRAVVLLGRGEHFCAGNDLREFATMTTENARERMSTSARPFRRSTAAPSR